jgi:hypothetical protein
MAASAGHVETQPPWQLELPILLLHQQQLSALLRPLLLWLQRCSGCGPADTTSRLIYCASRTLPTSYWHQTLLLCRRLRADSTARRGCDSRLSAALGACCGC